MSTTNILLLNNDIEIRVIKLTEYHKVLDFLRLHFYKDEPLTMGSEPKQQDKEDEEFTMSNIEHGTCLMAVKKDTTFCKEVIIGALMAGPKGPDEAEQLFAESAHMGPSKWGQILQFLAYIERDANVCKRFGVEKVLHVHGVGVNNKMRGQNIGALLVAELINLAKDLKYELVSADCTSYYSAILFERMGFDCINIQYYKDYLDENGKQLFKPHPIHEGVKTFALKF